MIFSKKATNQFEVSNRILALDWLRGFCALSIMAYHFGRDYDQTNFLYKLGIYGVSMFFILSGLSMAIVYNTFIKDFKSSLSFFMRRLFRIIPLHFIVCSFYVLYNIAMLNQFSLYKFLINITTLFGFIAPTEYIAMGAWSIGNEMVYYCFTPLIILLYNKSLKLGNLFFIFTVLIGIYFAFFVLDGNLSLLSQWTSYINPFNNLFLFTSGIFMYYNFHKITLNLKWVYLALVLLAFIFFLLPYVDEISVTSSWLRMFYCITIFFIVFLFYKMKIKKANIIGVVFDEFGMATYGIYLLHPLVLNYVRLLYNHPVFSFLLSGLITVVFAWISYYKMELPIMKYGKKLIKKTINV